MVMAHGVCDDDQRTIAQPRADALGALAAGAESLMCARGGADCPADVDRKPPPAGAVIHVVASAEGMGVSVDAHHSGEEPDLLAKASQALILGGPLLPATLWAELIAAGATVRTVRPGRGTVPRRHWMSSCGSET